MASPCRNLSFSTTSAPTTSIPMATATQTSTNSLGDDSVNEAGQNASTPAGDAQANHSIMPKRMPTSSRTTSKDNMGSGSFSDSSSSDTSSSSRCAKKRKTTKREKIPTENHLKIRSVADAGAKWEVNLQRVHGLTDEEACVCLSIVAKYLPKDEFPPPNGNRFVELAKEGWQHSKQLDRLIKAYPECGDHTNIDGVWIML